MLCYISWSKTNRTDIKKTKGKGAKPTLPGPNSGRWPSPGAGLSSFLSQADCCRRGGHAVAVPPPRCLPRGLLVPSVETPCSPLSSSPSPSSSPYLSRLFSASPRTSPRRRRAPTWPTASSRVPVMSRSFAKVVSVELQV